jgi:hypothetical protein
MQEIVQSTVTQNGLAYVDRRHAAAGLNGEREPRSFDDAFRSYRPEVTELAEAVDQYKLRHRRRFLTFDELYDVLAELGYSK